MACEQIIAKIDSDYWNKEYEKICKTTIEEYMTTHDRRDKVIGIIHLALINKKYDIANKILKMVIIKEDEDESCIQDLFEILCMNGCIDTIKYLVNNFDMNEYFIPAYKYMIRSIWLGIHYLNSGFTYNHDVINLYMVSEYQCKLSQENKQIMYNGMKKCEKYLKYMIGAYEYSKIKF